LILQDMKYTKYPGSLVRKLQKYTVQVYPYELELLKQSGSIQCVQEMFNVLTSTDFYSKSYGLVIPNQKASATDVLLF
jgi:CRISPR-associated endonuclease/helicase Cas3